MITGLVTVFVCDWVVCRNCTGGEEGIVLGGLSDWNYILCEEIGFYLEVHFVNTSQEEIIAICEINLVGQNGKRIDPEIVLLLLTIIIVSVSNQIGAPLLCYS